MKTIGLWAINGVGLGHTARQSLIARSLKQSGAAVRFLVEHDHQKNYLEKEGHTDPILVCKRPWKLTGRERKTAESLIHSYFDSITHLIGDLGSIPTQEIFRPSVPSHVQPHFLLRWMTKERWASIEPRIQSNPSIRAIIVAPERFFKSVTNINTRSSSFTNQVRFIDGFVLPPTCSTTNPSEKRTDFRIAFCCGAGGVHTPRGYDEFSEVLSGLSQFKFRFGSRLQIDAWTGSNLVVRQMCDAQATLFESIRGVETTTRPDWGKYDIVIGRCGYNTLLEVMQTLSIFVTGVFESDREWDLISLRRLSPFGLKVVPIIRSNEVYKALVRASSIPRNRGLGKKRRTVFRDATKDLVDSVLNW